MPELTPFSHIDPYWPEDNAPEGGWSEGQLEAAEFFHKLDWEGGAAELLNFGGPEYFPEELREAAEAADSALSELDTAIKHWGAARGVEY